VPTTVASGGGPSGQWQAWLLLHLAAIGGPFSNQGKAGESMATGQWLKAGNVICRGEDWVRVEPNPDFAAGDHPSALVEQHLVGFLVLGQVG
jgi:hypothetical protein